MTRKIRLSYIYTRRTKTYIRVDGWCWDEVLLLQIVNNDRATATVATMITVTATTTTTYTVVAAPYAAGSSYMYRLEAVTCIGIRRYTAASMQLLVQLQLCNCSCNNDNRSNTLSKYNERMDNEATAMQQRHQQRQQLPSYKTWCKHHLTPWSQLWKTTT